MKIVTIVGARPQFIKAAATSRAIKELNISELKIDEIIVHTGQHFDLNMSEIFFETLDLPKPKYHLGIAGLSHGSMTGEMIKSLEKVLEIEKPQIVLIFGDTNTTLAACISASKLFIPVAHVESGLRSFNMNQPEEINRIVADRLSHFLFCPTKTSFDNLIKEGFPFKQQKFKNQIISVVGDVMYDIVLHFFNRLTAESSVIRWDLKENKFALCTIHRQENTENLEIMRNILEALNEISYTLQVVMPIHPRTRKVIERYKLSKLLERIKIIDPVNYFEMQALQKGAKVILTDSGGLQKEAFFHKVPCLTLRKETEWTETIDLGANILVGTERDIIISSFENIDAFPKIKINPFGDGTAAKKIIRELIGIL